VVPARPALRSPKEGGFAGGVGNAALPTAPSSPQEAAVNEAALRQANINLSKQSDQKALGFDSYLGNSLARNGRLAAQDGTAPSEVDQVPVLGDVPLIGRLFQSTTGVSGGAVKADTTSATTTPASGKQEGAAYFSVDPETRRIVYIADEATANHIAQGLTHLDRPNSAGNTWEFGQQGAAVNSRLGTDANGASRPAQSPIVLPAAQPETRLALQDSSDGEHKSRQLATADDARGRRLNEVQIAKGITGDITGNMPKGSATSEASEPLQRRRADELAKKESDDQLPASALDFEQAKPDQVLDLYGKLVNRQILRPAPLPAPPISFSTSTPLTKHEAVQALEGALALNGITMVNVGDKFMKAVPEAQGNASGGRFDTNSAAQLPELGQYVTQVVQLKYAKPSELVGAIQPLAGISNSILPIDSSQMLVFRDTPENVKRISELVAKVDVATPSEYVSEVIPIKHAKASDIASALNSLSSGGGGRSVGGGKDDSTPKVAPKPATPAPIPQPEVQTAENTFSTFSLNVSDVSFKLAAASLEKGVMPEPATVRSEEFINAFDYRDPEPPPGVPVAFAWERAQYPFAQNRDLLRFSIKTAALGRQPGRALNIVLLLDNSGSMERADRVRIIREALRVLAGQLQPQDLFSVVTFARTAHLWVDGVPGNQAAQVAEEVSGLTPEGGTNLEDAMDLAYQTALRHYLANGVNRVVLLTDGAANLGNVDPEALKQKVEAHRKQGVALDCFGIGWEGYNDDLLEVLARNGDGRYAFLNSPEEVASEFAAKLAGALQVAASDVKVQVEFNPGRVTAYRQIGYAKHQLTKEQFRDNTVNAAQIGAAEAGNALYTVEVNPAGTGPLCTVRVRFRIPGTADYREHAWDLPYYGNAVALEQASPAMRLAATASALSEWLASSPYAGEVTTDRLLGYLSGVPEVYGADARPKKLEWMIRQAKSISGK
jgi:Mg-chelatase subunit ChlD